MYDRVEESSSKTSGRKFFLDLPEQRKRARSDTLPEEKRLVFSACVCVCAMSNIIKLSGATVGSDGG